MGDYWAFDMGSDQEPEESFRQQQDHANLLDKGEQEIVEREFPRVSVKNGSLIFIPEDVYWMAKAIYFEAGEEGVSDEGKEAVGWAIRNRKESERKSWGTTYKSVVLAKGQFESKPKIVNEDLLREKLKDQNEWQRSVQAAVKVNAAPQEKDTTGGADHFYTPKRSNKAPYWADVYSETSVAKVKQENFRFYKSK